MDPYLEHSGMWPEVHHWLISAMTTGRRADDDRHEAIECEYFPNPHAMTDRNIDQINHNLDQVLAISADNTRNIAQTNQTVVAMAQTITAMAATVTELTTYTRSRTQQHDEELDDHDVRVERLERDHVDHADRMAKLDETLAEVKDVQKDIRAILQIMTQRFAGE
jgi:septal ring factor EnvC (AmiA/AmiB activator)